MAAYYAKLHHVKLFGDNDRTIGEGRRHAVGLRVGFSCHSDMVPSATDPTHSRHATPPTPHFHHA